jgi:hypothetical protein
MRNGAVYNDAFLVCHEIYQAARELVNSRVPTTQFASSSKFLWRPDLRPRLVEYVADFARCGERSLLRAESSTRRRLSAPDNTRSAGQRGRRQFPRASRLILFRLYYLGGAEYEAARHVMGLSERTWSDWAEEVRARVGSELIRAGMYPPARYFREASVRSAQAASTKGAPEAKMIPVQREPDFD